MENELKEPTPQNTISTFDTLAFLVSIRKRTTQDQPQHPLGQFPSKMREHVRGGIHAVVFLIKFLDRVRELFKSD